MEGYQNSLSQMRLTPVGEVRSEIKTPIIDIKPHVQPYYGTENPKIPE